MITRRDFLATVGALAGVTACGGTSGASAGRPSAGARRKLDRIGLELYTVRQLARADMAGTLARVAEIGYREVEFHAYFGKSNTEIRDLLAKNGLTSPSMHMGFDAMKVDWDKTFDDALAKGHQYLIVPSPPNGVGKTIDSWKRTADDFNKAGERAKARGLAFGYHNHYTEFAPIDGQVPYDLLIESTDPRYVNFQMDVFWVTRGGGDPRTYLRRYPDRFVMLHIKDSSGLPVHDQVDIGAGTIDFASILRLDVELKHAVKHVYVEHDEPADPMLFAKKAFDYLSALEY